MEYGYVVASHHCMHDPSVIVVVQESPMSMDSNGEIAFVGSAAAIDVNQTFGV